MGAYHVVYLTYASLYHIKLWGNLGFFFFWGGGGPEWSQFLILQTSRSKKVSSFVQVGTAPHNTMITLLYALVDIFCIYCEGSRINPDILGPGGNQDRQAPSEPTALKVIFIFIIFCCIKTNDMRKLQSIWSDLLFFFFTPSLMFQVKITRSPDASDAAFQKHVAQMSFRFDFTKHRVVEQNYCVLFFLPVFIPPPPSPIRYGPVSAVSLVSKEGSEVGQIIPTIRHIQCPKTI